MDQYAVLRRTSHGRGPWLRLDPVQLGLAALALVACLGFGLDLGGRVVQVWVFWPLTSLLEIALGCVALRVSRLPEFDPTAQRLWRAMSFTGFSYAVGAGTQIPTVLHDPRSVAAAFGGPVYSGCVLVGTLWLIWTMLTSPLGLGSTRERIRFWLDVGTVMVAAATMSCYFAYVWTGAGAGFLAQPMQLLIGPTAFLVGVFASVKLLLGGRAPFTLRAGLLGTTAAVLEGVIRGLRPALVQHDRVSWELGVTVVVMVLLVSSARAQQLEGRAMAHPQRTVARRPYSVLPYLAIAATYLLLLVVLARRGLDGDTWILLVGAIVSTGIVVVRQLAAFTDNARLLGELDSKVDELNAALAQRDVLAARLHHQAFHDNLTGLANRALFQRRLTEATEAPASRAVMLVDLDDFKPVNDQFGHAAGDIVLTEVGRRLRGCVREADTVARLGGDEFAVLIVQMPGDDSAVTAMADRMIDAVQAPLVVGADIVSVGASIGVAVIRCGSAEPDEIMRQADAAMYRAKRLGKGRHEVVGSVSPVAV